jgi:leucyl-tRNA synthetase
VYKDGAKMSKSKGNVVFQTDISKKYGIDTARLFLMFVSSPEKQMEWSDEGIDGAYRIINKLIRLREKIIDKRDKKEEHKINLTIKEASKSIEEFDYPKAIISIVKCIDSLSEGISKKGYKVLLQLISPFCPHIAEELWERIGEKGFISISEWPECDEKKIDMNLEKEEQAVEKLISDIKNILKILESRGEKGKTKVRVFAIPKEVENYERSREKVEKSIGLVVEVFDIKEASKTGKAIKAMPGKPGILVE